MAEEVIYVLRLQDDCWYVGKTKDVQRRLEKHMAGEGAAWTKVHRPEEVVMERKMVGVWDEDNKVKSLMLYYGIDKVRGGSYSQVTLPEFQVLALKTEFSHVDECCFRCGKRGHYIGDCPNEAK